VQLTLLPHTANRAEQLFASTCVLLLIVDSASNPTNACCNLLVCREVLHQTEQRALQMKQLLQKDVLIKAAFTAYMFGRFTYTQVTGTC
jgi:hypothetical protein